MSRVGHRLGTMVPVGRWSERWGATPSCPPMSLWPTPDMSRPSLHPDHADFSVQGKTYTLGHLNSFDVTFEGLDPSTGGETRFDVRVSFDDHCYTVGIDPNEPHDPAAVVSRTGHQVRLFDPKRYALSRTLPNLIKSLMTRTCYFGDQDNFVTIDLSSGEKYNVYFQVFKAADRPRLRLSVRSAYIREQQDKLGRVAFGLILKNTQQGKRLRPPR